MTIRIDFRDGRTTAGFLPLALAAGFLPRRSNIRYLVGSLVLFSALALGLQSLVARDAVNRVKEQLDARRHIIEHDIEAWIDGHARLVADLARRGGLAAQLHKLEASPLHLHPEAQLTADVQALGYQGYYLVGRDRRVLSALRDADIGKRGFLAGQDRFFARMEGGRPAVSAVVASDIPLPDRLGEAKPGLPTAFAGAPVIAADGAIAAYLVLRIPVVQAFSDIFGRGRPSGSGAAYAFGPEGWMLVDTPLHSGDLVHTTAVRSALDGRSGVDATGYDDHRGVPVVGSWSWIDVLDIGVVVEQDASAAYAELRLVTTAIWGGSLLAALLAFGVAGAGEQARRSLAAREEYLTAVMEASGDGIVVIGADNRIEALNATAARIFGYEPEHLQGADVNVLVPPGDSHARRKWLAPDTSRTVKRIAGNRLLYGLHKSGVEVPIELSVRPMVLDGSARTVATIRDISERLSIERDLARIATTMRTVLDAIPAQTALLDEDGNITDVNAAWHRFSLAGGGPPKMAWPGYNYLEVVDRAAASGDGACAKLAASLRSLLRGDISTIQHAYDCSAPWDKRSYKLLGRRIDEVPGTRCVMMHVDITDVDRAQEELKAAIEEARRADQAKSAFLAAMSHEIRTPMNGVVGMLELLRETPLTDDQQRMARMAGDSAYGLLGIINDILDLSKIEAGRMELESVPVSIVDLVESVGDALWLSATQTGVELVLLPDLVGPDIVLGDPVRLRQIVMNLVGNAVKFSGGEGHQGVVRVTTRTTDGGAAGCDLRITVQDNGIGMSDEQLHALFKPFSQGDASTTRQFGGTGLGLTITKTLVDMMAGTIDVASTPGAGSTFTVTMRLPKGVPDAPADGAKDLAGGRFLLLEPSGNVCDVVDGVVSAAGGVSRRLLHLDELLHLPLSDQGTLRDWDVLILGPSVKLAQTLRTIDQRLGLGVRGHLKIVHLTATASARTGMIEPDLVVVPCNPAKPSVIRRGLVGMLGGTDDVLRHSRLGGGLRHHHAKPPAAEEAEAAGRLVLVAEDNVTSRTLLRQQLAILGYACEVTENGREALTKWRSGRRYGLILTDCQMPEMDGFDLSREIRRHQSAEGGGHVPIIAITANALVGESERCRAAGMDDYLSKPLSLDRLQHVLRKWMVDERPAPSDDTGGNGRGGIPAKVDPDDTDQPFDFALLASIVGSDDRELLGAMLTEYWRSAGDDMDRIEAAWASGDARALRDAAHAAKGGAQTATAADLGQALAALQAAAKQDDPNAIEAALTRTRSEFQRLQAYFAAGGAG